MTEMYIEETLQALHISRRYAGRRQLAEAVRLALEDESRLEKTTKQLFTPVAERSGCTPGSVIRNVRTVTGRTWELYPELLRQMARLPLDGPPSASEMVEIIMTYILRTWPDARP